MPRWWVSLQRRWILWGTRSCKKIRTRTSMERSYFIVICKGFPSKYTQLRIFRVLFIAPKTELFTQRIICTVWERVCVYAKHLSLNHSLCGTYSSTHLVYSMFSIDYVTQQGQNPGDGSLWCLTTWTSGAALAIILSEKEHNREKEFSIIKPLQKGASHFLHQWNSILDHFPFYFLPYPTFSIFNWEKRKEVKWQNQYFRSVNVSISRCMMRPRRENQINFPVFLFVPQENEEVNEAPIHKRWKCYHETTTTPTRPISLFTPGEN